MPWIHTRKLRGRWTYERKGPGLIMYSANAGFDLYDDERDNDGQYRGVADASDYIVDIREYDVPYHVRVAIDKG